MSKAAHQIIIDLLRKPAMAPARGWTARTLCKAAGLERDPFHAAIRALRYAGKLDFNSYTLSPSMLDDRAFASADIVGGADNSFRFTVDGGEQSPVVVPDKAAILEEVKAEAFKASANRKAARSTGTVTRSKTSLTVGSQVQDIALRDDPSAAIALVQSRWSELWAGVRASAVANGERPVSTMIRLIEAGIASEGAAR